MDYEEMLRERVSYINNLPRKILHTGGIRVFHMWLKSRRLRVSAITFSCVWADGDADCADGSRWFSFANFASFAVW